MVSLSSPVVCYINCATYTIKNYDHYLSVPGSTVVVQHSTLYHNNKGSNPATGTARETMTINRMPSLFQVGYQLFINIRLEKIDHLCFNLFQIGGDFSVLESSGIVSFGIGTYF